MGGPRRSIGHFRVGHREARVASELAQTLGERISLYFGILDAVDTPQANEACFATLSSAEKQRAECFVLERHRRQYIFAHGLLRVALSRFVPEVQPSDWCFVANGYGRPFIAAPEIARTVYFSLSHTEGCVACVVSGCEAVGVDVEEIREGQSLFATAQSNFSPEEIGALRVLKPADMVYRFFDYWTLKEAYLKARGTGINLPLNQFSILISSDQKIGIRFALEIADDSKRWHFTKSSPSARHRLAIADGSGRADGLPIVVQPWPLPQK
jgi:4'-phosphopantetheinyl transferase